MIEEILPIVHDSLVFWWNAGLGVDQGLQREDQVRGAHCYCDGFPCEGFDKDLESIVGLGF